MILYFKAKSFAKFFSVVLFSFYIILKGTYLSLNEVTSFAWQLPTTLLKISLGNLLKIISFACRGPPLVRKPPLICFGYYCNEPKCVLIASFRFFSTLKIQKPMKPLVGEIPFVIFSIGYISTVPELLTISYRNSLYL